jgi:hypothetical protein
MRQRIERRLPDRADVYRSSQTGTNSLGEPLFSGGDPDSDSPTTAGVACAFDDQSTSFVREDSGERVQRPASVRFPASVDIREGDVLDIDSADEYLEVRGVDERRDHRRGQTTMLVAEVERV